MAVLGKEIAQAVNSLSVGLKTRHHTPGYAFADMSETTIHGADKTLENVVAMHGQMGLEVWWSEKGRRYHAKATGRQGDEERGLVVVEESPGGEEVIYGVNAEIGPQIFHTEPGFSHQRARRITPTDEQATTVLRSFQTIAAHV